MPATIEISYFPINIYLINAQIKGKFPQDRDFQTGALPTGFFPSFFCAPHTRAMDPYKGLQITANTSTCEA